MKPAYRIEADGVDITSEIEKRFVSLTFNDNAGFQNDRVTLELDDREPYIELAKFQTSLRIWMGYEQDPDAEADYQGMADMGLFFVDEIQPERNPARRLKIVARANDTGGSLKSVKTRSWSNTTYKEMIDIIAAEHGLTADVHQSFASVPIEHLDQTNQSDQGFLTHLAHRNGAVFKVVEGSLFFGPRALAESMGGETVTTTTLAEDELDNWSVTMQRRSEHRRVTARTYDVDEAEEVTVEAESDGETNNDSTAHVEEVAPTEQEAAESASATAGQLEREKDTLRFSCVGIPTLRAETQLRITGLRQGVRDLWLITTVTHTIRRSGYKVSGNCEIPKP